MKKHKIPQNNNKESKRILIFFAVLILVMAAGAFLLLRNTGKSSSSTLPSISSDGFQEVRMNVNGADYEPSTLTVRSGQKVRWTVDGTRAAGCAQSMYSQQLGINTILKRGDNVFEFTPTQTGTIKFSCSMGMSRGQFKVV